MSENDEQIVVVGTRLANTVRSFGMAEDARVLDVGCGYGRLAIGLAATDFSTSDSTSCASRSGGAAGT